jgi:hypothetical protein
MLQLQPKAGEWTGIRDALQSSDRYFRLTMAMDSNSNEQESKQTAEAFKWVEPAGLVNRGAADPHACACSNSHAHGHVSTARAASHSCVRCCACPAASTQPCCSTLPSPHGVCS